MNALVEQWNRRPARERAAAAGLAGFVAVALVAALVWLPLERSRARLHEELPRLRASLAAIERDAAEVKRLRALPAVPARAATPLASLATNAGGLAGARIVVLDARRVQVTGADLSFAALLEWLRNAQATHGMRVESARLESLPAPGRVRGELVLSRA